MRWLIKLVSKLILADTIQVVTHLSVEKWSFLQELPILDL